MREELCRRAPVREERPVRRPPCPRRRRWRWLPGAGPADALRLERARGGRRGGGAGPRRGGGAGARGPSLRPPAG